MGNVMKQKNRVINPNEYGSLLFDKTENDAVINVMSTKRIFRYSKTEFPYTDNFEKEICNRFNVRHCLGVINGTAGLIAALSALGIQKNDRVLVSSYTYIATALAVKLVGGIPIPLEFSFENGVDIEDVKKEVDIGCKAVIITHLQGRSFDLEEIGKFLREKKVYLIEDSCQAFSANYKGKYAGTFGDVGVYSFQQFKQITSGEGGAVVTNNTRLYNRIRNYTDMGSVRERFPNWNSNECLFGQNYRISNISSAILFQQINKLDYMLNKQKESRKNILNDIKDYNINSIINSKDPDGDTGMNIIFLVKKQEELNNIIEFAKEKYNVELRQLWRGLYFENNLFIENKLTDIDLKQISCKKTKEIVSRMLVISIPPILDCKSEKLISRVLIDLKNNNYID